MSPQVIRVARFLAVSTFIYGLFFVRGITAGHYLDWSLDFQIADCIEIIIFTVPLTYSMLRWLSSKPHYFQDACWLALSFSVPYAIYDFVLLGYIRGYGLEYLSTFWFLTVFYFITLVEIPVIGYLMYRDDPVVTKGHLSMLLIVVVSWGLNWWEGSFSGHYFDWALNMKIVRMTNVVMMLAPISWLTLRMTSRPTECRENAAWLALYFSFTFALLDFLYLGIVQGHGLGYVRIFWHASILYPLFWIVIPGVGLLIERSVAETTEDESRTRLSRNERQAVP